MDIKIIVSKALPIVFANEGNYGSVNKDDNGALSVGKIQWHGNRALSLIKKVVKTNVTDAKKHLGNSLYSDIIKAKNWSEKILTPDEASKISSLLSSTQGKAAQDNLAVADLTSYIKKGQSYGLKDAGALIYFADGVNQYGTGSSLWKEIVKSALQSTGDIDAMYAATKRKTSKYLDRRTRVYKKIKKLVLSASNK